MAKNIFQSVEGLAARTRRLFATVPGDRLIQALRRAYYIGADCLARLTWTNGEVTYFGAIAPLSRARKAIGSGKAGDCLLFAGGEDSGSYFGTVDAYNGQLTKTSVTALSLAACDMAGGSVGGYAVFAGGGNANAQSSSTSDKVVHAYDGSLTRSLPEQLGQSRYRLLGVSAPGYFLVGPGQWVTYGGGKTIWHVANVDAYDASLTRRSLTNASVARAYIGGGVVNGHAIFAGGYDSTNGCFRSEVDIYGPDLTRLTGTALGVARAAPGSASTSAYALFAGGGSGSGASNLVEAFDAQLTKVTAPALQNQKRFPFGGALGDWAVFAGGIQPSDTTASPEVECYDENLTKTVLSGAAIYKYNNASCSYMTEAIGGKLLLAGEKVGDAVTDSVEVFTA